ncbi:hypothetical protein CPAV1605_437 [seawater metagenome]|uniref:Uncharacterized protein n=1 Tax=seawater metagenome TaxID=1561972 RepID=A0A5E8CLJ7_9ZZZZ
MTNTVCFDRNIFLIMVCIIVGATVVFFYNNPNIKKPATIPKCPPCKIKTQPTETKIVIQDKEKKTNPFVQYDKDALEDPLAPPYRRLPAYLYPRYPLSSMVNVPTRGYPTMFQFIGNLVRDRDNKFVQLFGRQTYPASNKYEYYGVSKDPSGLKIKIQISVKNDKELFDKDEIEIESLGAGTFILYLNELATPRYNPYVIG